MYTLEMMNRMNSHKYVFGRWFSPITSLYIMVTLC